MSLGTSPSFQILFATFFGAVIVNAPARANIGQEFGFGSRSASLGGASVAYGFGAFAAYSNPAGVVESDNAGFRIELGLLSMMPHFTPISGVLVENDYVADQETTKDVDTDYRSTLGQLIGVNLRLVPQWGNLSVGVTAFMPLQQVAYMDSGESYVPEYVLYRSRTQRPQVDLAFGMELSRKLKVGFGFQLAYALTSSATVFLQTESTKPSTMRFASSLKTKLGPQFGATYSTSETPNDPLATTFGAVLRLPVSSPNEIFLKSGARAFGGFAALDFNFIARSSLFYDPLTLELGSSFPTPFLTDHLARTLIQFDYQRWSAFAPPALLIIDPQTEGCGAAPCGVTVSGGTIPSFPYRNIVVPRIGQEMQISGARVRMGYSYRPSIFSSLPTGAGNYLDPPRHNLSAGLGWTLHPQALLNTPVQLDLHLAYCPLEKQTIVKAPGDETGSGTASKKIGSPGYDAGGQLYGGGITLGLAI